MNFVYLKKMQSKKLLLKVQRVKGSAASFSGFFYKLNKQFPESFHSK